MRFLSNCSRIITRACVYYTFSSLILYSAGMLASGIEREWIPTLKMMFMLLVFSLLFSAVNEITQNSQLAGVLKILIHYAATTLIFFVVFILWGGYNSSAASVMVILMAYTLIYIAVSLIVYFFRYVRSLKKSNTSRYESLFSAQRKD